MTHRNQNDSDDSRRRNLPDQGGDPRTKHPGAVQSSPPRIDESGKAKDDPSRAPESGTP